mmetsp:Transcript_504/g.1949  ORF Transcript_504/g.1949 Transcript_504/m.1949 type:complete len:224 (-) Transcript_504:733-1404(-)
MRHRGIHAEFCCGQVPDAKPVLACAAQRARGERLVGCGRRAPARPDAQRGACTAPRPDALRVREGGGGPLPRAGAGAAAAAGPRRRLRCSQARCAAAHRHDGPGRRLASSRPVRGLSVGDRPGSAAQPPGGGSHPAPPPGSLALAHRERVRRGLRHGRRSGGCHCCRVERHRRAHCDEQPVAQAGAGPPPAGALRLCGGRASPAGRGARRAGAWLPVLPAGGA